MARSLVIDEKIVQTKNCIPNRCYSAASMRFPSAPPGLPSWFPRNLIARLPDDPLYSLSAQKKPSDFGRRRSIRRGVIDYFLYFRARLKDQRLVCGNRYFSAR